MAKAPAPQQKKIPTKPAAKVRRKPGPKPWVPTESDVKLVRAYAAAGLTFEQIANQLGHGSTTLRKHPEIVAAAEAGRIATIAQVGGVVVKAALRGNMAAAFFYLKTQGGWRETNRTEHTGADGGSVRMETRDLSNLTDEQLDALERAALALASGTGGAAEPA